MDGSADSKRAFHWRAQDRAFWGDGNVIYLIWEVNLGMKVNVFMTQFLLHKLGIIISLSLNK